MIPRRRRRSVKALFAASTDDKPATMPRIRRQNLPPALLHHLLDRIRSREISADQLGLFAEWFDTEPEVPSEKWFKRFSEMIVCGEGELVKNISKCATASGRKGSLVTGDCCIVSRLRWRSHFGRLKETRDGHASQNRHCCKRQSGSDRHRGRQSAHLRHGWE